MKIYRWFWSHTIGRPFTYWRRDVYHLVPLVNIVVFVTIGFLAGFFYPLIFYWAQLKWYHLVELFALAWFIGVLQGHFYWTERYIQGQKVGDSVGRSYIAGLFDGEGSIIIKVKHYPESKEGWKEHLSHTIMAQVGNNDKGTILLLHGEFGGSIWNDKTKPSRKNFNQWHWEITGEKCVSFLRQVYPFLKIKKQEAKVAIDFQRNKSTLSLTERERERHYLHDLKGNKRVLKDYGINWGKEYVKGQKGE